MRGTQPRLRRLTGAAALSCTAILAALSFSSLPVGAQSAAVAVTTPVSCPVLSLANPNPGDNIVAGNYVVSGAAYDPAATSGSGIERVDLFLGPRDEGGSFLGSAVPGAEVAGSTETDPRAFSVEVTVPSDMNRDANFAAYAISSVSGSESSVVVPIFVGVPQRTVGLITPTPEPGQAVTSNNCPSGSTSTAAQGPASTAPQTAASPQTNMVAPSGTPGAAMGSAPAGVAAFAAANGCPTLSLGNPGPGDNINAGGYVISGTASVPGMTNGSGVSRVDLFLGRRDEGGTFLGSGIPGTGAGGDPTAFSVTVTVPNLGRGVDFAAYAIGTNGQEQATIFPVFVGAVPTRAPSSLATPTPVPTSVTIVSTCR
jgi:hypothetical protein